MKQLNTFWYTFKRSLLDPSYYRDVAKVKFGFSYKYLWFLLTLFMVVRTAQLAVGYSAVRPKIPGVIAKVKKAAYDFYPKNLELRISNGKLYTNVAEPYIIDAPRDWGDFGGKHLIVIDTSATVEDYPAYNTLVLATRNAVVYPEKSQGGRVTTQISYFNQIKRSIYIDKDRYTGLLSQLEPYVAKLPKFIDICVVVGLLLLPFLGGLFWASSIMFGLLLKTAVVWIVAKVMKAGYGYVQLFKMGMHASTWVVIAGTVMDITNQHIPLVGNAVFFVWMATVLWSVRSATAMK